VTQATTLPTTRDEDWRYADSVFLTAAHPVSLSHWRRLEVPAGETKFEYLSHFGGPASDGSVDRLKVHVGQGGRFDGFYILGGGGYQRMELEVTLEQGAHFEFGGVTVGGGAAMQEFVTRVIHAQPDGTSNQVVRAVQAGTSTGNFLGRIEVARDAQKTDAGQNFRAILLERGASANTKPELEIFADDVKCAHGAAIGALDEKAAFYMAARGIAPDVARRLLIQAFIGDAFTQLPDEKVRDKMLDQALAALEGAAL
jgi:Fe-S cluster assembly protein SufD